MRLDQTLTLGALCLSVALAGCNSRNAAAAATAGATTADRAGGAPLKVVALPDPSLGGITAVFVAVPAGWQADGQMTTNQCLSMPSPAWNGASSDGQSSFEVLPGFAWRWGSGARYGQGCSPFSGAPSAADFLKLFAAKLPGNLQIVGAMPIADAYRRREESYTSSMNNNNARLMPALRARHFGDVAAVRATDSNGRELRLRVWVQCKQGGQGGDCFARADVLSTPKGRLDALAEQVDRQNLVQEVPNEQWLTAYMNRQQRVGQQYMQQLATNAKAGSDMLHQQFLDSSARLRQEHEAGMEQIQEQGQHAIANDRATVNAMSTAASDWRDYAADQQTVTGANGTYKTSNQYSNVWSSPYGPALSNGRTFGSTDNTLDPNSATDNSWTPDVKVHGNGQSY
jgi:hypothetical protein